jgi:hypothetical protein
VVQHIFLSKTSSAVQVSCSWLGAAVATAKDGYWMVQSQSLAGEVQRFASEIMFNIQVFAGDSPQY